MESDDIRSLENMVSALGKKLTGFRRMYFYFEDQVIKDGANVEFEFESKFPLYFRGIYGGAKLQIVTSGWVDDFPGFSAEELKKIQYDYGIERRVELIGEEPYSNYFGKTLVSAVPLTDELDYMLGVELEFKGVKTKVTIFTSWDEDFVVFGDNSLSLTQAHLTAREDLKVALPAP